MKAISFASLPRVLRERGGLYLFCLALVWWLPCYAETDSAGAELADLIKVEKTMTMAGGAQLQFEISGDHVVLLNPDDKPIALFAPNEVIQQVAFNAARSYMLVRCQWIRRGARMRSYRHSRLLLVWRSKLGRWGAMTRLQYDKPPMNQLHRFVAGIESVSNNGKLAFLQMGEADREGAPYAINYYSVTMQLDDGTEVVRGKQQFDDQ